MTDMGVYQRWSRTTAVYPEARDGTTPAIIYTALGLAGEGGEIANKAKKLLRDGDTPELRAAIRGELGDVLWYLARLTDELGEDLDGVALDNVRKLEDRAGRGVLRGSGDRR